MNLDAAFRHIFGVSEEETLRAESKFELPMAYFNNFVRVVDQSRVIEFIEDHKRGQGNSTRGRKRLIPLRAVFVAMLVNNYWGFGSTYTMVANTMKYRFTQEQRDALGIKVTATSVDRWYHPAQRTMLADLLVLDPWYKTSKKYKLTASEYEAARAAKDESREPLANQALAMMLRASVDLLPKRYLEDYSGDTALDATLVPCGQRPNIPARGTFGNVEFTGGIYGRSDGYYDKYAFGYEADTVIMVKANKGKWHFPLITGADVHKPGEIKESGLNSIMQHHDFYPLAGIILVDRAYNGLKPHRFQLPIRKLGYETAYKYKKTEHGLQGKVNELPIILVDGNLYLNTMPEHLVNLHHYDANRLPLPSGESLTEALFNQYLADRSKYRLKAHGRPDGDGYQRFTLPKNIELLDHRDPVTGVPVAPPTFRSKSFTLTPQPELMKHIQKAEYETQEWKQLTGQRNQVEASNRTIKRAYGVDLHEYGKRLGRGITFQTIAIAFALAAENIRRILTGIKSLHNAETPKPAPKTRESRRAAAKDIAPRSRAGCLVSTVAPPGD